jgi:two-component system OmpR family response regulator
MTKIAMIEDDIELASMLSEFLSEFDMEVTNYANPVDGIDNIINTDFELLILDLTLPYIDGLEVCRKILSKKSIPIIISSARSDINDKITALELGADDYLPKPYDPRELEARIKSLLRRASKNDNSNISDSKEIFNFSPKHQEIKMFDKALKLTTAEYEILAMLIEKNGMVISKEDILQKSSVMGKESKDSETTGSLAVIINRIRQKIEENPKQPKYLHTVRGVGYKLLF